ncbi:ABC transporter ATP-binding protein [Nocardioides sp. Bht2]|uniref:ABC transporter ATP-binding protein n=1 Tax=Nocardioides sp. Bht2 TaxID=3392297 RepID=UPI0039B387F5
MTTTKTRAADVRIEGLALELDEPGVPLGEAQRLVRDVSFTVAAGEMVGLAGESGSGKSLTASAISGLMPVGVRRAEGTITIGGEICPPHKRHPDVAMIFQNPMTSLNPSIRIGDQIAEAVRLRHKGTSRSDARRRAVEILEQVEVSNAPARAKQYPFEFSGGMRQRAMIGIAIARDPAVLVADEPTTALDVTVQRGVMDLIDRLRAELGLAVLLISHDLGVMNERCDRLLVMYSGELVEVGPTGQLLATPAHPYVDGLLRCIPDRAMAAGKLEPLAGQVPPPNRWIPGCRFAERCASATAECEAAPIRFTAFAPEREVRCIHPQAASLGAGRSVR